MHGRCVQKKWNNRIGQPLFHIDWHWKNLKCLFTMLKWQHIINSPISNDMTWHEFDVLSLRLLGLLNNSKPRPMNTWIYVYGWIPICRLFKWDFLVLIHSCKIAVKLSTKYMSIVYDETYSPTKWIRNEPWILPTNEQIIQYVCTAIISRITHGFRLVMPVSLAIAISVGIA